MLLAAGGHPAVSTGKLMRLGWSAPLASRRLLGGSTREAPAATGVASAGASPAQRPTVAGRKRLRIPVNALQEVRVIGLVERHREVDLAAEDAALVVAV